MNDRQKQPIRVLHILHSMNRGGAETMIMNYYRNIDREQVQFDFLLTFQGKSDYEEEIISMGGRIFHITPLTLTSIRGYLKDIQRFLKEHREYKIVHSHTSSKSVFPLYISKRCKVPVRVSHSHNMELGDGTFSIKEILRKLLRKPLRLVSTHNFGCSKEATIWLYGEKYWQTGKAKVLPNAIDTKKFSYNEEIREKYRQDFSLTDNFVVGHVGRLQKEKNHLFLLEIFAEIAKKEEKAKLVLVGEGALQEEIEQKAHVLGIEEKVVLLGLRFDVPDLLQMIDVFVFPSLTEGLGIVLVEAQTAGLPCFASKNVIPEEAAVTDLVEFISLEESAKSWADKILKVQNQQERHTRISMVQDAGYDICVEAKKLEEFYLVEYKKNNMP
ncbi:MAG: glycosyltransferase family 1 protein [Lachnospiraceae bacterium]|nr:glycosyltransferase family 1 protein [Lachnospiraceae bacterium]